MELICLFVVHFVCVYGRKNMIVASWSGAGAWQPLPELLQGFDTATQITALAQWLRHHTARAVLLTRIALAGHRTPQAQASPCTTRQYRCIMA